MGRDSENMYEEARKQRLEDNKKRFEDLGISNISKSLSDLTHSEKKSVQRIAKSRAENAFTLEPRRSSRARNPIQSYTEEVDVGFVPSRKRSQLHSSWASYLARPLDEVKIASYEARVRAIKLAEEVQSDLTSGKPSFVKSMVRSHVYSCFWLGLPSKFCEVHLPKDIANMVLEDENGVEYEAVYIGKRTGLSGGWRAFALDKKLDDGDALVFELIEPRKFKIYIVRGTSKPSFPVDGDEVDVAADDTSKEAIKPSKNGGNSKSKRTSTSVKAVLDESPNLSAQKSPPEAETANEANLNGDKSANGRRRRKCRSATTSTF